MLNTKIKRYTQRYRLSFLLLALTGLSAGGAWAFGTDTRVEDAPFDDPAKFSSMVQQLPALSHDEQDNQLETRLAEAVKSIGEASMASDSDRPLRDQAEMWAFNRFRDFATQRAEREGEQLLSPYGRANVSLAVDDVGRFNGTSAQLMTPWQDNYRYLTFSQLGVEQTEYGAVGNAGLGQRWMVGSWRLGYNAFVDSLLAEDRQRASLGTELWGDSLRFSANYYQPLSGAYHNVSSVSQRRMVRGYDITTRGYLPFYRQLGVSLRYEQYLGRNIDLFHSGTLANNPTAVSLGINYTPVPLFTFSASHKEGDGGESQDRFALKMNYRIGVALSKQLSASNVDAAQSLSGSRYDAVSRSNAPVMAFRQRKSLSVFLATPPWQVQPGETLPLKLQIRNTHPVRAVSWQGDTRALSLTPPADARSSQGWSIIIPPWDTTPGATNAYRLSVTLEDSKQQKVTSNWIVLKLVSPVTLDSSHSENEDFLMP